MQHNIIGFIGTPTLTEQQQETLEMLFKKEPEKNQRKDVKILLIVVILS